MKEKEKILAYTLDSVMKEGISRTSIEMIAQDLGISKNTIYKNFPTKDDLLRESFEYFTNNIKHQFKEVIGKNNNAIEKLVNWFNFVSTHIMRFNDKFLFDVQIHYPEMWEKIDRFRKKMANIEVTKLIEQGKKEKLFLDFPTVFLVTIFIGAFRAIINPNFLLNQNYSVKEAFAITGNILLNTILSQKGKKLLKKLKLPQ